MEFVDNSLGSTPIAWERDFWDSATSTEQNPRHIYLREGTYDVSLTATNQYGSDTMFKTGSAVTTTVAAGVTAEVATAVQAKTPETHPTAAAPEEKPTTQAPLPVAISMIAAAFAMIAITVVHRK